MRVLGLEPATTASEQRPAALGTGLLGTRLATDSLLIAKVMVARARDELPAYRLLTDDVLVPAFHAQIQIVLRSASTGTAASEQESRLLVRYGEDRARSGVPLEEMLRAWRIGIQAVVDHVAVLSMSGAARPEETLDFVRSMLAFADSAMIATASGHRQTELDLARQDQERRAALVRGALTSAFTPADLRDRLRAVGLDPAEPMMAVRGRMSDPSRLGQLERALLQTHGLIGVMAQTDGEILGLVHPATISTELPGPVGLGPARPVDQLADSFRLASRAVDTAQRFGLTGAFQLQDLGIMPAVADDDDVGDVLVRRFVAPLGESAAAAEMLATISCYLANASNVERTALALHVHQNTVRYRLAKYEDTCRVSLKDTKTLLEIWWAITRSR